MHNINIMHMKYWLAYSGNIMKGNRILIKRNRKEIIGKAYRQQELPGKSTRNKGIENKGKGNKRKINKGLSNS